MSGCELGDFLFFASLGLACLGETETMLFRLIPAETFISIYPPQPDRFILFLSWLFSWRQ